MLQADRIGQPAVDLRTLERPHSIDDMIEVERFALPRRHPSILFGDGGSLKSYFAPYLAGRAVEKGISVAFLDWELAGDDHLERLFPDGMPRILYARCERPLVYEVDRLRRNVRDAGVEFAVYDSVTFTCDGPPESAEVAGRYFRASDKSAAARSMWRTSQRQKTVIRNRSALCSGITAPGPHGT